MVIISTESTWTIARLSGLSAICLKRSPNLYYSDPIIDPVLLTQSLSLEKFDASLLKLGNSLDRNNVTIAEDFNALDINWNEENSPFSPTPERFLEIVDNHDLYQHVNEPTRRTETSNDILDLVFSNISSVIGDVKVVPGISDHDIVPFTVNLLRHSKKNAKRKIYIRKN